MDHWSGFAVVALSRDYDTSSGDKYDTSSPVASFVGAKDSAPTVFGKRRGSLFFIPDRYTIIVVIGGIEAVLDDLRDVDIGQTLESWSRQTRIGPVPNRVSTSWVPNRSVVLPDELVTRKVDHPSPAVWMSHELSQDGRLCLPLFSHYLVLGLGEGGVLDKVPRMKSSVSFHLVGESRDSRVLRTEDRHGDDDGHEGHDQGDGRDEVSHLLSPSSFICRGTPEGIPLVFIY